MQAERVQGLGSSNFFSLDSPIFSINSARWLVVIARASTSNFSPSMRSALIYLLALESLAAKAAAGQRSASSHHEHIERAVQRALDKMRDRDALVRRKPIGHASLASFNGGGILAQAPFECPADLVKTGGGGEGKWLCGLSHLGRHRPCVVYSLGSNFDSAFEEAVQARVNEQAPSRAPAGCETHIYDPTLRRNPQQLVEFKAKLRERRIGALHEVAFAGGRGVTNVSLAMMTSGTSQPRPHTFPAQDLHGMLASNGNACVDILKVDVDGVEDTMLRSTRWEELCVGMLVFEIHGPSIEAFENQPSAAALPAQHPGGHHGGPRGDARWRNSTAQRAQGTYTVARALSRLHRLEKAGFMHYMSTLVCGLCPGQLEIGLVNVSWLREMATLERRDASGGVHGKDSSLTITLEDE